MTTATALATTPKRSIVTPARVRMLLTIAQEPVSLELPVGPDGDMRLADLLEDSAETPFDVVAARLLAEHVTALLTSLTGSERRVLQLRFGLEDRRARTLEEVGREFGVTRERIRQVEARALRKLRQPSRLSELEGYLD